MWLGYLPESHSSEGSGVTDAVSAAGETAVAKARDWKEPIGRVGCLASGSVM